MVPTYRDPLSGKRCLSDGTRRTKAGVEDRTDRGSVSRTGRTSQSDRREKWRSFEATTNYETLTFGS